ncbi:CHAT domain-containing protein [Nostoc favosum]|uniref:CHAT domain-containing protein n=1 Tax=Nostoc favosum CHAB5714 TaxID=2780399 RepID=A0ABS8ID47_9NOSO|nr:CHAT domain-containing protein [Nostoc favosum]MCC5602140.1 CHAT domain-containing protein [Nostoc favosum CHAB5714]
MKSFKYLLLSLLTVFFCVFSSVIFDYSIFLTAAFAKSKVLYFPVVATKPAVNQTQIFSLVQQSQALYEGGEFAEAVQLLKKAADEFKATNNVLNEAIALTNLSLVYQQLGQWQQANEVISQTIKLLQSLEDSDSSQERASAGGAALTQIFAQALDVRGGLELAQGQTEVALSTWQSAAKIYQHLDDISALTRNHINQAQAMQALGNYLQADHTLTSLRENLQKQPDSPVKAKGLYSLGNVLRSLGYLNDSHKILEESYSVAKRAGGAMPTAGEYAIAQSNALLSLGNTARAQIYAQLSLGNSISAKDYAKTAIQYYQQAVDIASATPTMRLQAQLNLLRLLIEQEEVSTAKALLPQIQSQIDNLPPSRTAVNYRINFAQSLSKMIQNSVELKDVAKMLAQAVQVAKTLKDERTESYALGTLGELYEQTGQLSDAKGLTQQALEKAESIDAQDIAYQWHWQMGRILQKQSNIPAATDAYSRAYNALKSLRNDLVVINPDVQFSFRESIEPVYRQYVDLLLQLQENTIQKPDNLIQARQVIESLQLAELDNFFRSPCLVPRVDLDKLVEKEISTAVIYPIILDNRLEIITRLPGQDTIYRKTTKVPKDVLEKVVEQLQKDLPVASREPDVKQLSQQLYDWLIKPIESDFANKGITSLVFVLDGSLRNIPIGILYDKQQQKYLIEKYAISLMPGLQLLDPKPLQNVRLNALIAGVEQERLIEGKSFPELANVTQELKQVQSSVQSSKELLNQEFTKTNLQNQIQSTPFSVVHLATHGQFSSDIEQTYILTWDSLLKVRELDSLLRARGESRPETIELLVLSACKTATGDKRAALGLAGVAVRAGARSTLATLWTVDDESTSDFMGELYRQLDAGVTKSQALQRAQLAILAKENRPYFWAPYVLLGNWL